MQKQDIQLRDQILNEILDSDMGFNRKMKVMQLLDQAFRSSLGKFYLSDEELEDNDLMTRSM